MNVKQLRNLLLDYDPLTEILIACDPEGNGFYQLTEIGESWIYQNDDKYGHVEEVYNKEDRDEPEFMEPRLVLWP